MAAVTHNLNRLAHNSRRVLLLQGPNGRFFADFAQWLSHRGITVYKINFNAGDALFYPNRTPHTTAYRGTLGAFPTFLHQLLVREAIDAVVCFGDNRAYHRAAKVQCGTLGIAFWAFEEGYFRPHYVTLESNGVNAFSTLPCNTRFYLEKLPQLPHPALPQSPYRVHGNFRKAAAASVAYYRAIFFHKKCYPHYVHHRPLSPFYYIRHWFQAALVKARHSLPEKRFAARLQTQDTGRFFIVPLQLSSDSQIRVHSHFASMESFMMRVLVSFARHAPADTRLIIKHHPMDRGFNDYRRVLRHFYKHHPECAGRIDYVFNLPLPILMRRASGMVTVNSTAGISALIHRLPVKVLGNANYDIPGITDQQPLNTFWQRPAPPHTAAFHAFRLFHLNTTQIEGSFYDRVCLEKYDRGDGAQPDTAAR